MLKHHGELRRAERSTEEIALDIVAILAAQEVHLHLLFDTFGNHAFFQTPRHGDHGADDNSLIRRVGDVADEGTIDLQDIDGEMFQVTQTGVSRPKIIDRQADPKVLEFTLDRRTSIGITHQDAFGQLQLEQMR